MASNKKKPMNKKNKIVAKSEAKKPVANKKVTVKAPVAKKPAVKRPANKRSVAVKKPVVVAAPEVKIEQVSIADQIPAAVCTCEKSCKENHTMAYVVFGVIVVALLLAIIF